MAYTKAPVNDTHNTIRVPPLGSPIIVSEVSTNKAYSATLSFVDCFERKEKQWGKDPIRRVHKRDGWVTSLVGSGNIGPQLFNRSVVFCEGAYADDCYFPTANGLYRLTNVSDAASLTLEQSYAVAGDKIWVSGTLAVNDSNVTKVCFLDDNGRLYTWSEDGSANTTTDLSALGLTGAGGLVFINGYLFAVSTNGKIHSSTVGGKLTTWSNVDFIVPEIYPDICTHIDKHKNYLVAFSNNSVEFLYDAAIEVGSPLARQESYTSFIGLFPGQDVGSKTCRIGDDVYFIGRNQSQQLNLYRVRDFRVEPIENQYIQNYLNYVGTSSLQRIRGVQTIIMNNEPMVAIGVTNGYEVVYIPSEDAWWTIRTSSDAGRGATSVNTDFPGYEARIWGGFSSLATVNPRRVACIWMDGGTISLKKPSATVSVQADYYSEVVDLGINYYKHIARVDAVGDFGNNTLTLAFNGTPNYSQPYTVCSPTRTPSSFGFGRNASWYNLGGHRRLSFKITMSGAGPGIFEGFDVEYNAGAA